MLATTPAERVASADAVRRAADGVSERASSYAMSVVREAEMARERRKQDQPSPESVTAARAELERAYMAGVVAGMQVVDGDVAWAIRGAVADREKRMSEKKARGRR